MAKAAPRPQTPIQSRIEQETALRYEAAEKGTPEEMPEISREITMCMGALEGVNQRLAELVARLKPAMDERAWQNINHGDDGLIPARSTEDHLAPQSEYGQRLRQTQHAIGDIENVLSYLLQGVRT